MPVITIMTSIIMILRIIRVRSRIRMVRIIRMVSTTSRIRAHRIIRIKCSMVLFVFSGSCVLFVLSYVFVVLLA